MHCVLRACCDTRAESGFCTSTSVRTFSRWDERSQDSRGHAHQPAGLGLEAAGTDAMDVAKQSTAAPVLSGKRGADRGRCGTFVSKRKPPDQAAGTPDGELTADLADEVYQLQGSTN